MKITFIGAHNTASSTTRLATVVIDDVLAMDAGSISSGLSFQAQDRIKAILLSHEHYDHVRDIPAFAYNNLHKTTDVYATEKTLSIVASHLLDGVIYPKFNESSSFLNKPSLNFKVIEPFKPCQIMEYTVLALPVNHTFDAVGFEIRAADGTKIFYTGDTGLGLSAIWKHISPQLIISELTFSGKYENTAKEALHLSTISLREELILFKEMKGYLPKVMFVHVNSLYENDIRSELAQIEKELGISLTVAAEGQEVVI